MNSISKNILLLVSIFLITAELSNGQQILAEDSAKTVILITGANRGIGFALAKKFNAEGYEVIGTARKPAKAEALNTLGIQVEQLDVTDPQSISALAIKLSKAKIDILLNNAGVLGKGSDEFSELDIEHIAHTLNVNSLGPLRVTQALMKNLAMGSNKTVANISSNMGSIANNSNGSLMGYRGSKSALNSFMKSLSHKLAKDGFTVVTLHPGWVVTDMTNQKGNFTATESAANLYKVISNLSAKDNGKFYNHDGSALPW